MTGSSDSRNNGRIKHKAAIQFENHFNQASYSATMYNCSRGGLYFECDYAPLPGTEIFIGIEDSPYDCEPDCYRAQVVWRKELSQKRSRNNYGYGVGVKYRQQL